MSERSQVKPPVSRARDRIQVDVVLASGLVLADCGFERPVPARPPPDLEPDAELTLTPGAIARLEGNRLTVSFDVLPDDVSVANRQVSVASTRRSIDIEFDESTLTHLVEGLSAGRTADSLIGRLPSQVHAAVRDMIIDLVGWEAVVAGPGARSRLAHEWSMRGARARGRLSPAEVADHTFSACRYDDDDANIVELNAPRDLPIDSLAEVLRQRRSPTRYDSSPISLDQLGQLLGTACGITGELTIEDRRLALRAYPSPGALYAVDIYVIPTRVEDLVGGVFRYDPERHALLKVHSQPIDPQSFCLPDVRPVVEGIASFIALSVYLPRATRKYGDESYRILVAEAGCIAENLVLVAHALGLRAGPFTGVFDSLVDQAIGQDQHGARFVVGVLLGHEGKTP